MRILRNLASWLTGCHARTIDDQGFTFYCSLKRGHGGDHEAYTCSCRGDGGCAEAGPVEVWAA